MTDSVISKNGFAETITDKRPSGKSTQSVHGNVQQRTFQAHHSLTTPITQTATYTLEDTADL
jgi:O-acetylhomoserine/O-acetylserine sulfhydrylase-like pyridoxal-dependent enzyme